MKEKMKGKKKERNKNVRRKKMKESKLENCDEKIKDVEK
jgi:predicted nuclease with TOPRIM domain